MDDLGTNLNRLQEQRVLMRVRARRRFKALVRMVIEHGDWLDDDEFEELSDNVQKNVRMIKSTKEKQKGQKKGLTLEQKSILRKPVKRRTKEDKKKLYGAIGNLKCFKMYPQNIKERLVNSTFFEFYGPNRELVKQNHPAESMYFILSGEALVTYALYHEKLGEYQTSVRNTLGPGNMFGEIALLHNIRRIATITTITSVELLRVKKDDFDKILKKTIQGNWDYMVDALARFSYFRNWSPTTQKECCIITRVKSFDHGETILTEKSGNLDYIHFVVRGSCKLVQHLMMKVTNVGRYGRKVYELYKPNELDVDEHEEKKKRTKAFNVSIKPSLKENRVSVISHNTSVVSNLPSTARLSTTGKLSFVEKLNTIKHASPSVFLMPRNVETHFLQVCTYKELACFNVGESLKWRTVIATGHVELLMIPREWLLKQNDKLWSKVRLFLETHVPDTRSLYKQYMKTRAWNCYKKKLIADLHLKIRPSENIIHNVPFSIRLAHDV